MVNVIGHTCASPQYVCHEKSLLEHILVKLFVQFSEIQPRSSFVRTDVNILLIQNRTNKKMHSYTDVQYLSFNLSEPNSSLHF